MLIQFVKFDIKVQTQLNHMNLLAGKFGKCTQCDMQQQALRCFQTNLFLVLLKAYFCKYVLIFSNSICNNA